MSGFLSKYSSEDLNIASEFLSTWLPFLSTALCSNCITTLTHRIRSLHSEVDGDSYTLTNRESSFGVRTPANTDWGEINDKHENCYTNSFGSGKRAVDMNDSADTNSLGSWKEAADLNDTADTNSLGSWKGAADMNDTADTNSLGSWGDGTNKGLKPATNSSVNSMVRSTIAPEKMSRADSSLDSWGSGTNNGLEPTITSSMNRTVRSTRAPEKMSWDDNSSGSWGDGTNNRLKPTMNSSLNSTGRSTRAPEKISSADNFVGSWGDGTTNGLEPTIISSMHSTVRSTRTPEKKSWADMAPDDRQLEGDEESEVSMSSFDGHEEVLNSRQKTKLSRDERECIRFNSVKRKKDFICFERFEGRLVNILEGLELHTGVFSAVEQKRIVDFVYTLQEMGMKGELKARTFTAPAKWMKGKGRVTIQFGCCYNYAVDKDGNRPGILQSENVDPIPHLLKVMIRRLVAWHVLPPSCVPDSCIVNIYDVGDCIPPHIDHHDFVRPFCTVSFLSECNILFGSKLSVLAPGEFSGPIVIPLPVGSVLVLNGNGADVAKHCVPAVPAKRISITFRKMEESKRPCGFVPEPDLQGLEPLTYETRGSNISTPQRPVVSKSDPSPKLETVSYETDTSDHSILSRPSPTYHPIRQEARRENYRGRFRGSFGRGRSYSEPHSSLQIQTGSFNRRKVRVDVNGDDTLIIR